MRTHGYRLETPAVKASESLWALVNFGVKSGFPKRTGHIDTYSFDISMSAILSTCHLKPAYLSPNNITTTAHTSRLPHRLEQVTTTFFLHTLSYLS